MVVSSGRLVGGKCLEIRISKSLSRYISTVPDCIWECVSVMFCFMVTHPCNLAKNQNVDMKLPVISSWYNNNLL